MKLDERYLDRFLSKISIDDSGCWLWMAGKSRAGYGQMRINKKTIYAHRLSYEINKGDIPYGFCILHSCDNPACVNPEHLSIGTQKDNLQDMWRKKRGIIPHYRGEKNSQSKLTAKQVKQIRKLCSYGAVQSKIAKRYGVSNTAIGYILSGRNWGSI